MRRTIGAWAENFGIIEPSSHNHHHHDERERLDEVKGEELFVMPGWAVVKYRPEKAEEGAPSESNALENVETLSESRWTRVHG